MAAAAVAATGPAVGIAAGLVGARMVPMWLYGAALSASLLLATWIALTRDAERFASLGLAFTRRRVREFAVGFVLCAGLYAAWYLARAALVGASWTPTGLSILSTAVPGLAIALFLMLPEELVFRGYAFRRAAEIVSPRTALVISSLLFGLYHVIGSGMWGMGAFFTFSMPVLGGLLFGFAAQRTGGLALPIGLHLGGNWIQASVLAFRPAGQTGRPNALWTAEISGTQFHMLTAPDLPVHLPFIMMIAAMSIATIAMFRPRERT